MEPIPDNLGDLRDELASAQAVLGGADDVAMPSIEDDPLSEHMPHMAEGGEVQPKQIHKDIRDIAVRLAGPKGEDRVNIADLRDELGEKYEHEDVTSALWDLASTGDLSLMRYDNPREIKERDTYFPVTTSSGEPKHFFYWGGSTSTGESGRMFKGMAEGGDVPDIEKFNPVPEFVPASVLGMAGIAGMIGGAVGLGTEQWPMIGAASLAAGAIQGAFSLKKFVQGTMDYQRKKHADPILEEMAEDAAHQRRPERFAEGGDVHNEYQALSAELEGLQNEYDNADAEKRKEIWARIQPKSELAGELKRQIDAARRGDDFEPPQEWMPNTNDPDEPDYDGPDTRPRPHSPRPSPAEVDYSMAFAQGGEVPVMLEPGEKVTPPAGEKEWEVPVLEGKPDSGDVVPAMLEPGTHVTPKDQFAAEQSIPHMAHGGDVIRPGVDERLNDAFDAERDSIDRDDMSELTDAIRKLTETVTKVTDAMEKSGKPMPSEAPGKVRSTTFDPVKAKERFGKPPGGVGHASADALAAYARSMAAR